ncbi:hypothetical protein CTAYLR_007116 [Chrysophaeum taylorii]|uniref:NAD(P)-binding domain-containing protein n=1 Tax=Chrysophaeum taylorii TaxID=2483200 RepID=A0AAD7XIE9_9STRA|nr:hypothetical protein CTAYLR_007116 [Chrysophaeum taylorii]
MKTTAFLLVAWQCNALSASSAQQRVVVAGATGRVGRLVVSELLSRNSTVVTAIVRDDEKAKATLPLDHPRLEVASDIKLTNSKAVETMVSEADVVVWCATGFSDAASPLNRLRAVAELMMGSSTASFDVRALGLLGDAVRERDTCRVVCCSSAAVTRPAWDDAKKERYKGASDIPIVRLNPLNILDVKRTAEETLRVRSGGRYTIVRPTGLNDDWPRGRVVVSQGDLAVGRISRADVAAVLASLAVDVEASVVNGLTFEMFALAGYPAPASLDAQLARLRRDDRALESFETLDATYALLQQLVPGETLRPQDLAMGQTYEQLDAGETGRLGARGAENVPPDFVRT